MKRRRMSVTARLMVFELILIALIALFMLCGYIVIEV